MNPDCLLQVSMQATSKGKKTALHCCVCKLSVCLIKAVNMCSTRDEGGDCLAQLLRMQLSVCLQGLLPSILHRPKNEMLSKHREAEAAPCRIWPPAVATCMRKRQLWPGRSLASSAADQNSSLPWTHATRPAISARSLTTQQRQSMRRTSYSNNAVHPHAHPLAL